MSDRDGLGPRAWTRRVVALLPRPRRGARGRHDPVRGLPRTVRQGRRPGLGGQADARPLELPAAGDHLGLVARRDGGPGGGGGGRRAPPRGSPRRLVITPGSPPTGPAPPHAAGIAYAVKYREEDAVVA